MLILHNCQAPHSRKGIHDSYNDETFGSSECTDEDRVEEERKRRGNLFFGLLDGAAT